MNINKNVKRYCFMNLQLLNKINFHDAELNDYKRDERNISFVIKDGWLKDTYYKIELKNIQVQVMNNKPEHICYILDKFNSINDKNIILYSGEFEMINVNSKYYLKLWIDHPNDIGIETKITMNEYKFDGMNVELCNDYDDTGRLYIKFIFDYFDIIEL